LTVRSDLDRPEIRALLNPLRTNIR